MGAEEPESGLTVFGSFDELPAMWDAFFAEMQQRCWFWSRPWFENLVTTTLEEDATLRLYALADGDRPLALLATRSPAGQNGSALSDRPLGGRTLASLTNYQTMDFAPLLADPADYAALERLVRGIARETPRWTLVDLNVVRRDTPEFELCVRALRAAGFVVRPYFFAGNSYETVAGRTWEEYLRERPSVLRNTLKRKGRKLEKSSRVRFELVAGLERLNEGIAWYERVLAASWKKRDHFAGFTEGYMRGAAGAGALRLGVLFVDDEPVAAQAWLLAAGRATIFKLHYDERFGAQSVGTLCTARLMQHVIEVDRVEEVDFGTFDDDYKTRWLRERRELWGIAAFQPRTVGGIAALSRHTLRTGAARIALAAKRALVRSPNTESGPSSRDS